MYNLKMPGTKDEWLSAVAMLSVLMLFISSVMSFAQMKEIEKGNVTSQEVGAAIGWLNFWGLLFFFFTSLFLVYRGCYKTFAFGVLFILCLTPVMGMIASMIPAQ